MKKFLLPIVGLMLGGAAAQAEQVTCKYYSQNGMPDVTIDAAHEVFISTTNELINNGGGSYTLKNFENSGYDYTFVISQGKLTCPGMVTSIDMLKKDPNADPVEYYYFSLKTTALYKSMAAGGEEVHYEATGKCQTYVGSPAQKVVLKAQTATQTEFINTYEVHLGSYFEYDTPLGYMVGENEAMATHHEYGVVVFDLTVSEPREGAKIAYQTASGSELFKNSMSPVTANEDGSVKLEYFANSDAAFTFTIDADKIADGKAPLVFSEGISSADPDAYQTLAGATFSLETAAGVTKTGALAVRPAGCYATPIEGTATLVDQKYNVYIDTKFGDEAGYAVFEAVGPLAVAAEGEVVNMIYKDYTSKVVKEEIPTQIIRINETTILVKNYLNSGYDIPLVFTKEEVTGEAYFAQGTAKPTEEYIDSDDRAKGAFRVKIPEDPTLAFTAVVAGVNVVNPQVYYYGSNGYVRYYNENGKIRTHVYAVFGAPWNIVEWDLVEGGDESGIQDVAVDENAPVEWFNLQGVRVNGENLTPGIYIKRQGSKAVKVLVR